MNTITIDRAIVEQALEVLENLQGGCTDSNDGTVETITVWCPEVIAALRAELAQQAEPEPCTWQQDGDSGVYGTSCGRYFNLDDGTPEDNEMHWCCYCGKRLVQELLTEEDDDERS